MNNLSLFKDSKVLITGHTGFKGSWLSLWLCSLGAKVFGLSIGNHTNPSHFQAINLQDKIDHNLLDIRDGLALKKLIQKIQPDFVFHLAAQALVQKSYLDPVETWSTNTIGTINVLEGLRELDVPCVAIMITSDKCYDNLEWVWGYRETDALGGGDPYSASKASAELAISSYIRSFFPKEGSVRIGIGRAGNVIGGGDWAEDRIIPDCIRAWSTDKVASLRNPLATRPWQHVLEPLSGYIALSLKLKNNSKLHGEPFNFGPSFSKSYSVSDLVSGMANHWDKVRFEEKISDLSGNHESGLLKLNCDKALYNLEWHSCWDFDKTVKETALWYRNYYSQHPLPPLNFSLNQIYEYQEAANQLGLMWAK